MLPPLKEISDCSISQLRFNSHSAPGVSKGRQVLNRFWTEVQKPTGFPRFSPLCDFPETTGASGVQKTRADQNETPSRQSPTWVRGEFRETKEGKGVTGWTLGDTLGKETHCMVAPSSVTYLEVIFFVWLLGIPFITGHLSTKETGKLSMNTCEAVHELQHQNLAVPPVQTVQYEFKHTPNLLDMTVQRIGQINCCAPLTTCLSQPERESRDRGQIVAGVISEGGEIKLYSITQLLFNVTFYCGLYIKTGAKNIHIYSVNLLIIQHAIHISSLLRNTVSSAVRLCLFINCAPRRWHLSSLIILAFCLDITNSWEWLCPDREGCSYLGEEHSAFPPSDIPSNKS